MSIDPNRVVDPIGALVADRRRGTPAAALERLEMSVTLAGALAAVETKRVFRNRSAAPVETLLTFPVPVQAAFHGLDVELAGKMLTGVAKGRRSARDEYEDAIEEGRLSVLHEELLRGVHMLSVANLGARAEVAVTTRWAETLRCTGADGHLRIPLTIGDVYGESGLGDADEPARGGATLRASLRVRHDAEAVELVGGGSLHRGPDGGWRGQVANNAPVDLAVTGWDGAALKGRAADGRAVELECRPCATGREPADLAILVDRSGSMASEAAGQGDYRTKHEAVVNGLYALAGELEVHDRIALWEFDTTTNPVGTAVPAGIGAFADNIGKLGAPRGGTEIGAALEAVIAGSEACDVLLVTDGKSYALDVHSLARESAEAGRRISAVLVGEDSLEANVGHLAVLTGGSVRISVGNDAGEALRAAMAALRTRRGASEGPGPEQDGAPRRIATVRGGLRIEAKWAGEKALAAGDAPPKGVARAVGAYAASLAMATMDEGAAEELAAAEGLVTHLTSLVVTDETVQAAATLPTTVKISLADPRTAALPSSIAFEMPDVDRSPPMPLHSPRREMPLHSPRLERRPVSRELPPSSTLGRPALAAPSPIDDLGARLRCLAAILDWNAHGDSLAAGRLDELDGAVRRRIRRVAEDDLVHDAATSLGLDPEELVVALAARIAAAESRNAARVLRRLLANVIRSAFDAFAALVLGMPDRA